MNNIHYIKATKLVELLVYFVFFVNHMDDNSNLLSFRDNKCYLGREEDYKSVIAEEARKELKSNNWDKSWIGTGKIAECAKKAMGKANNLVNKNQQIEFKNKLDPSKLEYQSEAEQVLFDIYRSSSCDESTAFSNAVKTFGAKYETIAFLFFIKDDSRFLPISPGHFDKSLNNLKIDYSTSYRCSWENYIGFINIVKEIRSVMEDILPMEGKPRLIDAHSFMWIIQEDIFKDWVASTKCDSQIEQLTESYVQKVVSGSGGRKSTITSSFIRNANVVRETKKRANGTCQYCNQPAPFFDKKGVPYLEVHHIVWLSRGGEDNIKNTVALCPNCHTRMHVLDEPKDIEKLKEAIK